MSDDVGYVKKGVKGRTCAACKHYEPDTENRKVGKCMGHNVEAKASCKYFDPKK